MAPVSDACGMNAGDLPVTIVHACLREGHGGSPTAVLDERALSDRQRRSVPAVTRTSHAVFVWLRDSGHDGLEVSLRFFTATGELPACGHGTVAALAFLAERAGGKECQAALRTPGGVFTGRAARVNGHSKAGFDSGPVEV